MPSWTAEFAYEKFLEHHSVLRSAEGTNEATTRLRAIDTMIFDVLGWDRQDVFAERYVREQGFSDYAFLNHETICLIVEAKKAGTYFVLPEMNFSDRPISFALLSSECPAADSALRQAQGYAAAEGARYVAITNGHQWLLALTFVPNQPITERSVFVFSSLDAITTHFRAFWRCFGPEAILGNLPADSLLESRKAPAPAKLSSRIANYPLPATRNRISNEVSGVLRVVWDEVQMEEGAEEFLRKCYVFPDASSPSMAQTHELLRQRLSTDEAARSTVLDPRDVPGLIAGYVPEKPIIVLGRIGHGKTTFLRYLRKVEAAELFNRYIQIDINFLDRPDSPENVGRYVYSEVDRQLRENYGFDIGRDNFVRGVLHFDLQRFRETPEGLLHSPGSRQFKRAEVEYIRQLQADPHEYLAKVLRHLRAGRQYSLALFFDNLDRRPDSIQEEAFLRASALARDWEALVLVCLRPGTYFRSRHFGVLDSVAPRVIQIVSPKTKLLVSKRLNFAKEIASGISSGSRPPGTAFGQGISFDLPTVADFLECCAISFSRGTGLAELFESVSNGNARDLLAYVFQLLTSLHLDTEKILSKFRMGGYQMPVHEALRALLFGDSMHYDPSRSPFVNLFDIERSDRLEHFSRFVTLHHLASANSGHPSYGYVSLSSLRSYLSQLGFSEEHSKDTVQYLFDRKCIESKMPGDGWADDIDTVKVTSLGRYHVMSLVNTFNYMDAIAVDTPILEETARARVGDVMQIKERLQRCRVFVAYLDECSRALLDARLLQLWRETKDQVNANIRQIELTM